MGSPVRHPRYILIGGEHGVTDLLSELGNIVRAQAEGLHFWEDLDDDFPWKSETGGSEREEGNK